MLLHLLCAATAQYGNLIRWSEPTDPAQKTLPAPPTPFLVALQNAAYNARPFAAGLCIQRLDCLFEINATRLPKNRPSEWHFCCPSSGECAFDF
jgi:hypothetical protein